MGMIDFIRPKKKALGILGGATLIKVFLNGVSPYIWHLSEDEVAENYRKLEQQIMVEKGIKTGAFKLVDISHNMVESK
ncbi:MAG: hypothetical protein N2257_05255 [Thermodesulfovibrionales bacterium]|nr:hypothetical protein [Thermodesulfovibrionales bacterium]